MRAAGRASGDAAGRAKRAARDAARMTWMRFKGRLKEAWGGLTDDDLDRLEGRRDQLIGYLQEKSGRSREALERDVDDVSRDAGYRFE